MARVIVHWTAGGYRASALDREHYHVLIEGDGTVVYGVHAIDANAKPAREPRASHTRNCNTGSIGVSVCCMKDAREQQVMDQFRASVRDHRSRTPHAESAPADLDSRAPKAPGVRPGR